MHSAAKQFLLSVRLALAKSDILSVLKKFNPNHDERGRFTSGEGSDISAMSSEEKTGTGILEGSKSYDFERDSPVPQKVSTKQEAEKLLDKLVKFHSSLDGLTTETSCQITNTLAYLKERAPNVKLQSFSLSKDGMADGNTWGWYRGSLNMIQVADVSYALKQANMSQTGNVQDAVDSLTKMRERCKEEGRDEMVEKIDSRLKVLSGQLDEAKADPFCAGYLTKNFQQCIVAHEYGHAWHDKNEAKVNKAFKGGTGISGTRETEESKTLSAELGMTKYGKTLFRECFAENFCAYMMGYASLVHPRFKAFFDKEIKPKQEE